MDMKYKYSSYKIDEQNSGSDIAAEIAATLAAVYLLFKVTDSAYDKKCVKHVIEIYDFAINIEKFIIILSNKLKDIIPALMVIEMNWVGELFHF